MREVSIKLKSGQRALYEVEDDVSDQDLAKRLQGIDASVDKWAAGKKWLIDSSTPPPGMGAGAWKFVMDSLIPGSPEVLLGDLVMMAVSGPAGRAAAAGKEAGMGLLRRAGLRMAGPAAGAVATATASEETGDIPGGYLDALGMFLGGTAIEGAMAIRRFAKARRLETSTTRYARSADDAQQIGQAVHDYFPNIKSEQELVWLLKGGGAEQLTSARLAGIEQEIMGKVGNPRQFVAIPAMVQAYEAIGERAKAKLVGKTGGVVPFEEAWEIMKQLRALRRGALAKTEPLVHAKVLKATDELER